MTALTFIINHSANLLKQETNTSAVHARNDDECMAHRTVIGSKLLFACFAKAIKITWCVCVLQVCTLEVHRSAAVNNPLWL